MAGGLSHIETHNRQQRTSFERLSHPMPMQRSEHDELLLIDAQCQDLLPLVAPPAFKAKLHRNRMAMSRVLCPTELQAEAVPSSSRGSHLSDSPCAVMCSHEAWHC